MLTLKQVSKITAISYSTLLRYVRLFSDVIPHEGQGRTRRFYPAALGVFRRLRLQSGRHSRPGGRRNRVGRLGAQRASSGAVRRGSPPQTVASALEEAVLEHLRDLNVIQKVEELLGRKRVKRSIEKQLGKRARHSTEKQLGEHPRLRR